MLKGRLHPEYKIRQKVSGPIVFALTIVQTIPFTTRQ